MRRLAGTGHDGAIGRPRALLIDLFGTLVAPFPTDRHRDLLARMAGCLAMPVSEFVASFELTAKEAISGRLSSVEQQVRQVAGLFGATVDDRALAESLALHESTVRGWLSPRAGALAALGDLRRQGARLGVVTNCSSELPRLWKGTPMAPLVDEALFSSAERVANPDRRIFRRSVARLGVAPAEAAFVSDGPREELEAAASIGIEPILFDAPDLPPGHLGGGIWHGRAVTSFFELAALWEAQS